MPSANVTSNIKLNKTRPATIRFLDELENTTTAPPGAAATYTLKDFAFNAEQTTGAAQVTPDVDGLSAAIKGIALGDQAIEVTIPGLPAYRIAETTTPGPATHFVVDLGSEV